MIRSRLRKELVSKEVDSTHEMSSQVVLWFLCTCTHVDTRSFASQWTHFPASVIIFGKNRKLDLLNHLSRPIFYFSLLYSCVSFVLFQLLNSFSLPFIIPLIKNN